MQTPIPSTLLNRWTHAPSVVSGMCYRRAKALDKVISRACWPIHSLLALGLRGSRSPRPCLLQAVTSDQETETRGGYLFSTHLRWGLWESHSPLAQPGPLYYGLLLAESEIRHQVDSWHNLGEENGKEGMTSNQWGWQLTAIEAELKAVRPTVPGNIFGSSTWVPKAWSGTSLWPVKNQALQQEVSSGWASEVSSAAPHHSH